MISVTVQVGGALLAADADSDPDHAARVIAPMDCYFMTAETFTTPRPLPTSRKLAGKLEMPRATGQPV